MINHEKLFTAALQLQDPLYVEKVEFSEQDRELNIHISFHKGSKFKCSECGVENLSVHDTVDKVWRHLNFFQYKAFIHFRTPRTICPEHGVRMVQLPWAAPGSGFTLLFEALVLQLAQVMPMKQVAKLLNEHDTLLWRILNRYVNQARKEADYSEITRVGVDETSSKRRHNYVTLFVDMDKSQVVHVTEGKDSSTITSFKGMLQSKSIDPKQITDFSADMSIPFRKGLQTEFPWSKVTFDKFHVIKLMNEALDEVRRQEQRDEIMLKHSRYIWLSNAKNLKPSQHKKLVTLSQMKLKTARAYRIKLALQDIYLQANDKYDAMRLLTDWYNWAVRSRLGPIKEYAKTVKSNWVGILNYFDSRLTNAVLESMNSIVQSARNRAKGYRNVRTFITMIYLLGGQLNLEIKSASTHSI